MSILSKHIAFVNTQIEFQERMMNKYADNQYRQQLHQNARDKLKALSDDLEITDKLLDNSPAESAGHRPRPPIRLSITPEDIDGLPEEVLRELSISEGDKVEFAIMGLIEEAGGVISLDRLIIGLWRKTGEVIKRANLTSKLYRMAQKNMIYSVPGKKGVYSTRGISEEEAARLFSVGDMSE